MVGKNILEYSKKHKHAFLSPSSKDLNLLDYNAVANFIKKKQTRFYCSRSWKSWGYTGKH